MKEAIDKILSVVGEHYHVSPEDILSHRYGDDIKAARKLTYWLASKVTGQSYYTIARHTNRRARESVGYGVKAVNSKRLECESFNETCSRLLRSCGEYIKDYGPALVNQSVTKPASDNRDTKKLRKCLLGGGQFMSSHIGERICPSCKEKDIWRGGGGIAA